MGALIVTDPASGRETIIETFTCAHCNTPQRRYTFEGKRLPTRYCGNCKGRVCDAAKCVNTCLEYEKRLDIYDRVLKKSGRQVDIFQDVAALEDQALIIG